MRWMILAAVIGVGCDGSQSHDSRPADAAVDDAVDVDAVSFPANAPPVGSCENGWCWVYPLPQGWPIALLWGTSASDVWAVSQMPGVGREAFLHYDGSAWRSYELPDGCGHATQIWGAASNDAWAIGDCLLHWDGNSWTGTYTGYQEGGVRIGGASTSDVWLFNNNGSAFHWDGTQWEPRSSDPSGAVGGSGSTTLMVTYNAAIYQWTGTAWGLLDAGSDSAALQGIVIDATHIVVLDQNGDLRFWNNGTWTMQAAPEPMVAKQLVATSLSDVWIAGTSNGGQPVFYHWNGSAWSPTGSSIHAGHATAMWAEPGGSLWLGSDSSEIAVWNGAAWTAKTMGRNSVAYVWGTDWDNIWTLGDGNVVMHWNGSAWSDMAFPYSVADGYNVAGGAWASAADDVWIAGGKPAGYPLTDRVLFHWNGVAWSSLTLGTETYNDAMRWFPQGFRTIWGAAANDIYAGAETAVFHYDGNNWTQVSALTGGNKVFGSGASDVYVSTPKDYSYGDLWRWDGVSWKKLLIGGSSDGWANSPTDVWLSCGHYDGTLCVQSTTVPMGSPIGSSTDMYTFGYADRGAGEAFEWIGGFDGTTRSVGLPPLPGPSRWRTPDGHIFISGGGLIVR